MRVGAHILALVREREPSELCLNALWVFNTKRSFEWVDDNSFDLILCYRVVYENTNVFEQKNKQTNNTRICKDKAEGHKWYFC